jgi:antitoxin MazE
MRSRISKWGNSLGIRIPKPFVAEAQLQDGTEVELTVQDGRIIITPVSSHYVLDDLVRGITAENRHTETDWGEPTGSEVW